MLIFLLGFLVVCICFFRFDKEFWIFFKWCWRDFLWGIIFFLNWLRVVERLFVIFFIIVFFFLVVICICWEIVFIFVESFCCEVLIWFFWELICCLSFCFEYGVIRSVVIVVMVFLIVVLVVSFFILFIIYFFLCSKVIVNIFFWYNYKKIV